MNTNYIVVFVGASLVSLAVIAACTSSSTGGTATPTTVDSTKTISMLSDADNAQLCHDIQNYTASALPSLKSYSCAISGALLGGLSNTNKAAACKSAYNACINGTDAGVTVSSPDSGVDPCVAFEMKTKQCEGVTVGELSQCLSDQVAAFQKINESVCDGLLDDGGTSTTTTLGQTPPSCVKPQEKCPDLLGGSSTGTGVSHSG